MTDHINYIQRLNQLKAGQAKAAMEGAKAEANVESLTKRQEELIQEIVAQGVDPANLDEELAKLDRMIEAGLSEAESMIPREFMS